jgi:hypothetical protein
MWKPDRSALYALARPDVKMVYAAALDADGYIALDGRRVGKRVMVPDYAGGPMLEKRGGPH